MHSRSGCHGNLGSASGCAGDDPGAAVLWSVDVSSHQGQDTGPIHLLRGALPSLPHPVCDGGEKNPLIPPHGGHLPHPRQQ